MAGPEEEGRRLDAVLVRIFPALGLRARRRLCLSGCVQVQGRAAGPGRRLRCGERVSAAPLIFPAAAPPELRLLTREADYCAFFKPAGLASARIKGGGAPSAEFYIQRHWASIGQGDSGPAPLLCNRLDTATSGILLGAFSRQALQRFRELEQGGLADKLYYALVRGLAPERLRLEQTLDTDGGNKAHCLPRREEDRTRHTVILRLALLPPGQGPEGLAHSVSLLQAHILRGARHQIRAHLAGAGLPIIGDSLYDPCAAASRAPLYLHHARLSFPGFSVEAPPPWPGWTNWGRPLKLPAACATCARESAGSRTGPG